jgi:1-deoxy-D-xylulose-5-phosphate reductoisomerase
MPKKKVTILGSTGSIGQNSLRVIQEKSDQFGVIGLSTKGDLEKFNQQIQTFCPKQAAITDEDNPADIQQQDGLVLKQGRAGLAALAQDESEVLINALVGAVGIEPAFLAAGCGKRIALANKESLVAAGQLIISELEKHQGEIIPVDSEHSAIFQCLKDSRPEEVEKIIITASGGPFRNAPMEQLEKVTVQEALNHPTWKMGAKITIDSATMMNKGLEVIEAHFLFNIPYEKIEIVVHPQSIVHSMVQFVDGSVLAHLGNPDMRVPIQYALTYPKKEALEVMRLDFSKQGSLDFEIPDEKRFPCIALAYAAGRAGGTLPAVMNAANEVAVDFFLKGRIGFTDIPKIIERAMGNASVVQAYSLADILAVDRATREEAAAWVS